jgi:hypothetical protein
MLLNPNGGVPFITANFGGINFAKCTIFFKKEGGSFLPITDFDNSNSSGFTFPVDPAQILGANKNVSDLIGGQVGWTVTFIDFGDATQSQFSFDLQIKQDASNLLPPFSKNGTIDNTSITFSDKFTFQ